LRDDLSARNRAHKINEKAIKALQEKVMAEHQSRFNSENVTNATYSIDADGNRIRCYQEITQTVETFNISDLRTYVLADAPNRLHLLQGRAAQRACIAEAELTADKKLPGVNIVQKRSIKYEKVST